MASSKKWFLGFVIVLAMVGCSRPASTLPPVTAGGAIAGPSLPPKDYRKLLRDKASERHFSFTVYCTNHEDEWAYQGDAWPSNTRALAPIEDGGKGFWSVHAHLQSDAIRMLYELLSDVDAPPTISPYHSDPEIAQSKHEHKQCDPPFNGGPQ